ncbi:MAG: cytochrome C assembly protein [Candidatus Dadabacteria bacterium]|nr:MAG: cytochrome C assembly protein [Candidatus Dadabacteria bacterium]
MIERVERLCIRLLPWPTAVAFLVSLWAVFVWVPTERMQGPVQRIFYYHVPSAWVGFLGIFIACGASIVYLYNRRTEWDHAAHAGVEVGVLFATIVLITGPFWARPIWGTWWTWDSRLTTTLILWLIFVAYLLMRQFTHGSETGARFAAVLAIVGTLDIPLIILSTRLWRTIHPAVLRTREGESGLTDPAMITTLLICVAAFTMLFGWLWALRLRTLRVAERIELLEDEIERGADRT